MVLSNSGCVHRRQTINEGWHGEPIKRLDGKDRRGKGKKKVMDGGGGVVVDVTIQCEGEKNGRSKKIIYAYYNGTKTVFFPQRKSALVPSWAKRVGQDVRGHTRGLVGRHRVDENGSRVLPRLSLLRKFLLRLPRCRCRWLCLAVERLG